MTVRSRIVDFALGSFVAVQLVAAAWMTYGGEQVLRADGRPLGTLCLFHRILGVDCPFCGLTRSFIALAHGHVIEALRFHPAGPFLFAAMLLFVGAVVVAAVRRTVPIVERQTFRFASEAVLVLSLAIGVLKLVRS